MKSTGYSLVFLVMVVSQLGLPSVLFAEPSSTSGESSVERFIWTFQDDQEFAEAVVFQYRDPQCGVLELYVQMVSGDRLRLRFGVSRNDHVRTHRELFDEQASWRYGMNQVSTLNLAGLDFTSSDLLEKLTQQVEDLPKGEVPQTRVELFMDPGRSYEFPLDEERELLWQIRFHLNRSDLGPEIASQAPENLVRTAVGLRNMLCSNRIRRFCELKPLLLSLVASFRGSTETAEGVATAEQRFDSGLSIQRTAAYDPTRLPEEALDFLEQFPSFELDYHVKPFCR